MEYGKADIYSRLPDIYSIMKRKILEDKQFLKSLKKILEELDNKENK